MTRKDFLFLLSAACPLNSSLGAAQPAEIKRAAPAPNSGRWHHSELTRFPAPEATQAVAVDEDCFYAIANFAIGKYRKQDGRRVGGWEGQKGGPIVHLNAGLVRGRFLYCAHSNFPSVPMVSSVEIWNTATMRHVKNHSLGVMEGSLTWLAWREKHWWACFAHYKESQATTGGNPAWTQVLKFDDQWRRVAGWVFPPNLIERFGAYSSSGGAFGPDGALFVTGHSAKELYRLELPRAGSVLTWTDTIPISAEGQAFAWDPARPGILYSISRSTREVIVSRVSSEPGA